MGKFTTQNNPLLDETIDCHMVKIVDAVRSNMDPIAIILRGSFGRGEGSVAINKENFMFYSDYEIDVATYSPFHRSLFKKLSRQLTGDLNVSTSLRWVRPDYLVKNRIGPFVMGSAPISISLYESRYGSLILYGKDFIHSSVEIDPREIRKQDGIILVLNRMAESMLYMDDLGSAERKDQDSYYWVNKTILACTEALLLLWGQYHYSYAERGKRFAELADKNLGFLPDGGVNLANMVDRATRYKLNPDPNLYTEPVHTVWKATIPIVDLVFKHLAQQILEIEPCAYEVFPPIFLKRYYGRSAPLNFTAALGQKLLEAYRSLRAHHYPPAFFGSQDLDHIVYANVPLVFHCQASDDCAQTLRAARTWMNLLGKLESPSTDPVLERNYLRQKLTWFWKIYCYG